MTEEGSKRNAVCTWEQGSVGHWEPASLVVLLAL